MTSALTLLPVPMPDGVPNDDPFVLRMLRALGDGTPELATIPKDEREVLMQALTAATTRALYRRHRFDHLLAASQSRWDMFGGQVFGDMLAKFVLFEATDALTAASTVVDEILYIAARRAGESQERADEWTATRALNANLSKTTRFDVPEVRALQGAYRDWVEELRDYRNAMVHRGWREQIHTYFPVGCDRADARDPGRNVMLIPERASVRRPNRPHQWSFSNPERLERLVVRVLDGLLGYVDHVAHVWGGSIPAPGTVPGADRVTMIVFGKWGCIPQP